MTENPSPAASHPMSDPATGSQQLAELLDRRQAEGFACHFGSREGAVVRCFTCHHDTPATDMAVVHIDRLEGASDPDDMLAVVSLACPGCGARGTLICGYGPNAGIADAEVLQALPDEQVDHRFDD